MKPSTYLFPLLATSLLAGCQLSPSSLSDNNQQEIRSVAQEFTSALRAGDAERLHHLSIANQDNQHLAQVVIDDTVTSRKVLDSLSSHFGYVEQKPTVTASNSWIDRFASTASAGPIRRSGDRVLLASTNQGEIYLRNVAGAWKVDLIPTLVPESGGEQAVHDPIVEYRFSVTKQLNQWMLTRLENDEFHSKPDFDRARSKFWTEYLTYAANGKDPQDTLLPSLPVMPKEEDAVAQDR